MYKRVLVPIDDSPTAERGLHEAIGVASVHKATLVLLHVVDDVRMMVEMASAISSEQARATITKAGEDLLAKAARGASEAGVSSETVVCEVKAVPVSDVVLREAAARQCDLIVMGTHGRKGVSRIAMGSDAERVVRGATVPVLLIRHPEAH